jgi:hypothetical protein
MPYILSQARNKILYEDFKPTTAGELNFLITSIIDDYIKQHGLNYGIINELIGVLECSKLELYRRIAAPYEDSKIEQNGDVYTSFQS